MHRVSAPVFAAALLLCGTALGAPVDDLLKQGIQHFDLARFEEARRTLDLAQTATKDPHKLSRIYLYFGLIEAVSGSRAKARTMMVRALEKDPTLTLDPGRFKKDLVDLFNTVRGGLRGAVLVHARQPLRTVYIDGKRAGRLPVLTHLTIGEHQIQVRASNGRPIHSTTVVVRPHVTGRVAVDPGPGGPAKPERAVAAADPPPVPQDAGPSRRRIFTWIAAGAAVAMLGAGIGLGVSANQGHKEWEDGCRDGGYMGCSELALSVENQDLAANVMFAVGGSLAVTAALLFFLEDRSPGESRERRKGGAAKARVTPIIGPSAVGGSLSLSF